MSRIADTFPSVNIGLLSKPDRRHEMIGATRFSLFSAKMR